ncbi:DNA methyltransferase [Conexibacter sp. CPCC 206217]|uniref:DNA methyltransferase n=1 Tax=Conexibacter sp. CPCC 206217 TaxID=3064574 RepID=UPI00351C89C1
MDRVLHTATDPGDLVLDCFAGSGTTAAVAQKVGRRWIAFAARWRRTGTRLATSCAYGIPARPRQVRTSRMRRSAP